MIFSPARRIFIGIFITLIALCSFVSTDNNCESRSRRDIPPGEKKLYDSLFHTRQYLSYPFLKFSSDSIQITDSVRIKTIYDGSNHNLEYYPYYLQFRGTYEHFLNYILSVDPTLDSVITCDKKVRLYYSNRCDFCDSGFWYGTANLSTLFFYYRFEEIYASFFSFSPVNEIQVFVGGVNKTYLPYASDLAVYAPGKSMKKKWFVKDVDYATFFPPDFPSSANSDFIEDANGDYVWKEGAADRMTSPRRK